MRKHYLSMGAVAWVGLFSSSPAHACMQQRDEVTIFTKEAPPRPTEPDLVRLFVKVVGKDQRGFVAELLPPFDKSDKVRRVLISDSSTGSDCSRIGPADGPAWVVGHIRGVVDGTLYVSSIQRHWIPANVRPSGAEDWRSYVVDPDLKALAGKR